MTLRRKPPRVHGHARNALGGVILFTGNFILFFPNYDPFFSKAIADVTVCSQ